MSFTPDYTLARDIRELQPGMLKGVENLVDMGDAGNIGKPCQETALHRFGRSEAVGMVLHENHILQIAEYERNQHDVARLRGTRTAPVIRASDTVIDAGMQSVFTGLVFAGVAKTAALAVDELGKGMVVNLPVFFW